MKPWLALTQLERDFELVVMDVLKGEQKAPEFLDLNPLGVVPFLLDDDGTTNREFGLGESNAMLWYIAEGTDLIPDSAQERAEALQWMFFEQSKLEPFISPARFHSYILPDRTGEKAEDIARWQAAAKPGLARLNAHLEQRQFILCSGYSIADIALFGYVHTLAEAGLEHADYPEVLRWIGDVCRTKGFRPLSELGTSSNMAA